MNYLVHVFLSDDDPLCRIGNLMGDFVKGRLQDSGLPPGLLRGIRQHRAVDRLAWNHPAVRRSKARLDDGFGHTKGILVDIFYDHFLSRNWTAWTRGSLQEFTAEVYELLKRYEDLLTDNFRPAARWIIASDLLTAYRKPETIELVLQRVAARMSRPTSLALGYLELARCGEQMQDDCRAFLHAAARKIKDLSFSY